MIRHIFIGTFKPEVNDATKAEELAALKAIKEKIPGVVDLQVAFSTGWVGSANSVAMTVDLESKEDFDKYLAHPYHAEYLLKLGAKNFSGYVAAQFEL